MFVEYPDVVNVEQMRERLGGIGVTLAYRLLKKDIQGRKVGRDYKIPKISIIEYIIKSE